ncbi:non-ribosomal peptide synthetase [Anaeromicropila populeti]|uniref:Yersiniabactin nonribosomal peptide synthetase n=1 Tax=Anaeromicropila populeti TaxID=37658 RepID=A0A1I6JXJ8_9FIRM|nr:non-ribosomal peptide synthetase [Anaeromicropila populeti]SFR83687.1 yersiniabactin nonribosomal peptide synthetase [Anaeromicropila populeti]
MNSKNKDVVFEYEQIKEQIKSALSVSREFADNQNLLELGLNSLQIMRLVSKWRKAGAKVTFAQLIEMPTLENWCRLINENLSKTSKVKKPEQEKEEDEYKPFPLTDVQYAYWVGRRDDQPLGGGGCHAYIEFDGVKVEPEKLKEAWNLLRKHHKMLRMKVLEDGQQEIMEQTYSEDIKIHNLKNKKKDELEKELTDIRESLSHRRLQVEIGQVAGLALSLLPEEKTRIHFDIDLLVADVQSFQIVLRDLTSVYAGKELSEESKNWNFAEYLKKQKEEEKAIVEGAKEYWSKRISSLPMAPELPLSKQPDKIKRPVFHRRITYLNRAEWEVFQNHAARHQVTPAMVLLTAYTKVLERWSSNKHFLINIPLFNRNTDIKGMEDVVADFTTLLLLEVDCREDNTFEQMLYKIKTQFYQDMAHSSYSGVQVQRDMAKIHGGQQSFAPVVFACNLGMPLINEEFKNVLGNFTYMISQTPQVWIDFQTYESEDGLMLTWDVVEELFPEYLIDDMFSAFERLLHWLVQDKSDWSKQYDLLPEAQRIRKEREREITLPSTLSCIHEDFLENAYKYPSDVALIDSKDGAKISYGDLENKVSSLAAFLLKQNITNGEAVAISLPAGVHQIIAVLGTLAVGNYYIPVSIQQPSDRRQIIHNKLNIQYVITDREHGQKIEWPDNTTLLYIEEALTYSRTEEYPDVSPLSTAYIILTSGSTGEPKGVEISHFGAWNTIKDVNQKYQVSHKDRLLAVSSLDFDLSVYDVFGCLGAGGTLVLLPEEERKNAGYWLQQIKKYEVTIWNSVPVLLDMLLIAAEGEKNTRLPLKTVMLSGDWIGLDIPERLANLTDKCQLAAMGGATEASIWSNYFTVTLPLPENWVSIPYGKPLSNQAYRVVDDLGRDCPDWVKGELWIGGAGVAKGYFGDEILTQQRFVVEHNIRWYKTGDMGRFWADGNMEFLGRKDYQVKIRGHRIELGEIEAAMRQHPEVREAVAVVSGDDQENKYLSAFFVPEEKVNSTLFKQTEENSEETDRVWELVCPTEEKIEEVLACEKVPVEDAEAYYSYAESMCVQLMHSTLMELGAFGELGEILSAEGIVKRCGIDKKYSGLVKQWLDSLANAQILIPQGQGKYSYNQTDENNAKQWNNQRGELITYFEKIREKSCGLLRGEINPLGLFYDRHLKIAPTNLLEILPGSLYENKMLQNMLAAAVKAKGKIRILEIGTRNNTVTKSLLSCLPKGEIEYTYIDHSLFFIEEAKEELQEYSFVQYSLLDLEKDLHQQGFEQNQYDCILGINSLHRCKNINKAVEQTASLLAPEGLLFVAELTRNNSLQKITAGFLEEEWKPLLSEADWMDKLENAGFTNVTDVLALTEKAAAYGRHLFIGQIKKRLDVVEAESFISFLKNKLPEYMIPKIYHALKKIPVTANGKVDRKSLQGSHNNKTTVRSRVLPETDIEKALARQWKELFGRESIGLYDNYFELGGDSLVATKLLTRVRNEFQVEISLGAIFEKPTIKELAVIIENAKLEKETLKKRTAKLPKVIPEPQNENLPFPLTEVQYAYWIGRSGVYDLGNVSTHCYFELDGENLDLDKLNEAWQRLILHHGMMRAIILPDGTQKILKEVPEYRIEVMDIRGEKQTVTEKRLKEKREKMSHQMLSAGEWPLFDIKASCYGENKTRLHISFDNLVFDGWSMFHVLNEWTRLYRNEQEELIPLELSFRDYVIALEKMKESKWYQQDEEYWFSRLDTLPAAPELPLAKEPSTLQNQKFHRRTGRLSKNQWEKLKMRAKALGITPSGILLSAYAEVLGMWSKNQHFTINLTQFTRVPLHSEVNRLVGDFTTLTLLEVDQKKGETFQQRAKNIQHQIWRDMEHPYVGGVQIQRQLAKRESTGAGVTMPVVFTSGLGIHQWKENAWPGELVYNISQTPQVWLDHQVIEQEEELVLMWDSVDELFYPGVLDEMFKAYNCLLEKLSQEEDVWKSPQSCLISAPISRERLEVNETGEEISNETLDGLFLKAVRKYPEKAAVICGERILTYQEVLDRAYEISSLLKEKGVSQNSLVAIIMEKGWEQVVAAMGILLSGAAYLPVDARNPQERKTKLLEDSGATVILSQSWLKEKDVLGEGFSYIYVDQMEGEPTAVQEIRASNEPENLAYVIYTSGTTGMPKGVMISHRGAVNTILDINRRFLIGTEDRALALSNLNFDLSVYDVFGMLSAGAATVIPKEEEVKNPVSWKQYLREKGITIWNTVPAFMQIMTDYLMDTEGIEKTDLRLVLLSGDWIPVDLPEKIKTYFDKARVISLGGATEASIWSNYFEVQKVGKKWISIPYGYPLTNQRFYILNSLMEDCPDWVTGELYIGGAGLAKGYWKDAAMTNQKFVISPKTGEPLYRTGDLGRYWQDGTIEFLGREDSQVKIRGHRIELGEIEAVLREHPAIQNVVVVAEQERLTLSAAVTIKDQELKESFADGEELKQYLQKHLPDYFVPGKICVWDEIPLSANGKIDKKPVIKLLAEEEKEHVNYVGPQDELEKSIAEIWAEVLGVEKVSREDDFFLLGGDSLRAMRVIGLLDSKMILKGRISIKELFEYSRFSALAEEIKKIQWEEDTDTEEGIL